jgi:hypothetical protein
MTVKNHEGFDELFLLFLSHLTLPPYQGRYRPCSIVAEGTRHHPHLPAPEGRGTTSLGPGLARALHSP